MKNIGKFAVLGAVLAASASFAHADIILGSYGQAGLTAYSTPTVSNSIMTLVGTDTNNTALPPLVALSSFTAVGTPAYNLNPESVWAAPVSSSLWVGATANAGPQSTVNPPYGYYEFTTQFTVSGMYQGTLNILADDTAEVLLTNSSGTSTLIPFGSLMTDGYCAGGVPNCLVTDSVGITALSGVNTLTFVVEQAGTGPTGGIGDPTGFSFNADLSPTPEPGSLMLLGTGLVSAAGIMFRRRKTV